MRTVLFLLLALALAPAAHAKGITRADVCGAHGDCLRVHADDEPGLDRLFGASLPADAPAKPSPWFDVRIVIGGAPGEDMEPVTMRQAYFPELRLMRVEGEGPGGYDWWDAGADTEALMRRLTLGLEPRPAGKLPGFVPGDGTAVAAATPAATPASAPAARPPAPADDGAPAWPWVAGGALAALALLAALMAGRRRGRPVAAA